MDTHGAQTPARLRELGDELVERVRVPREPRGEGGRAWIVPLATALGGLLLVVVRGRWLVSGAIDLARIAGMSEATIGLTIVAIGTSGSVYPAAGFVAEARANGIRTCELNLEPSDNAALFDDARYGPAGVVVPAWAETVLA